MTRAADRLAVEVGGSAFPLICHTHLFIFVTHIYLHMRVIIFLYSLIP